jgi:hypothetical protein
MKKVFSLITGLAIIAGIFFLVALYFNAPFSTPLPPTNSGVHGTVLLGPTCPVQRIPPDPKCADRPYQADFVITSSVGGTSKVSSGADGKFEQQLPPGDYTIAPSNNGKVLPRAGSQVFTVQSGQFTEIQIQFDSGIR